jgi:hypothetical protein
VAQTTRGWRNLAVDGRLYEAVDEAKRRPGPEDPCAREDVRGRRGGFQRYSSERCNMAELSAVTENGERLGNVAGGPTPALEPERRPAPVVGQHQDLTVVAGINRYPLQAPVRSDVALGVTAKRDGPAGGGFSTAGASDWASVCCRRTHS